MPWPGRKQHAKARPVSLALEAPVAAAEPPRQKSLWVSAFNKLGDEKPDLVRKFVGILESEAHSVDPLVIGQQGPPTQKQLSELIERKLALMKDRQWRVSLGKLSIELRTQIDRVLQIVVVAKDLGSSLASLDPIHAGLPWAGVCMLLPLLLNDSQQRTVVINGLESIAKLIRRFSEIETFYLRKTQHRLCEDLEEALTTLYFHVLEFEARSLCQFNRNTAAQTGRNIVKADGWQDIIDAIDKSEITCNILTRIIDVETQHKWNDQIEALIFDQASKVDKILELSEQNSGQPRRPLARRGTFKEDPSTLHQERDGHKCLALLRTTDYEFDKDKNPTRLTGTCEWFLNHPVYQKWHQHDSGSWLWLTANPGCGKSVLARSLVDESCGMATESQIYYFFFKDDTEKNRNVNHALCAILHQLIYRDKSLIRHAMDAYYSNGEQLPNLVEPLWKILLAILKGLPEPVIFLFDALDECTESSRIVLIQKLAMLFLHEPESSKLKVIMTSRPNTPIGHAIWEHGVNPVSIQLTGEREVESQAISEEIDLYIDAKIRQFKDLRAYRNIHDEAHEILHERLKSVENRTYLWVSLIFPELELHAGVSKTKLLGLIKQIPTTVQEAYEKILSRSLDKPRARILLHIIVAAYHPLTLTEMNFALAVQDHSNPMEDLDTEPTASFADTIRELCGLFIMVKKARVYLIHQTAKEFLVQMDEVEHEALADVPTWNWRYSFKPVDSHRILARTCTLYLYLSYLRREKAKSLGGAGQLQDGGEASHYLEAWETLSEYAGMFWMDHFSEAGLYGAKDVLSPIARIYATSSTQQTLTWAHLYRLSPNWSTSPKQYVSEGKFNALDMASFHGHAGMVSFFLNDYTATEKGIPSIRWALQNNHTTVAHALLDSISSEPTNNYILNAAFHMACSAGEESIVSRLLTYAVVDSCRADSLGRTALFWAARGGHEVLVQVLIKLQKQYRRPKDNVGSSLLAAAFRGFGGVIDALMSYGPVESNECRIAALYQAVFRDQAHVLQRLLEDRGSLIISQSELEKLIVVALTYEKKASVEVLLEYPFNVNARDANGESLLLLAADEIIKEKLINMGADVNVIATSGWHRCYEGVGETSLYRAVVSGHYKYAQVLLRHGAALDVRCWNGETALYRAVAAANLELVRLLLNAGANPAIENQYGSSPIQLMRDQSNSKVQNPNSASDDQIELLALMEDATHRCGGQINNSNATVRQGNLILNPQIYRELLENSIYIDWETFEQFLQMDDVDEGHEFTRTMVSNIFRCQEILAQAKDAILSGDFGEISNHLDELFLVNCEIVGLKCFSKICEPFRSERFKSKFWVGCRHDGEEEGPDVERLSLFRRAFADLQLELPKMEKRMQDFYYEIQSPRFDPDAETFAEQERQLLQDASDMAAQAPTAQQAMNDTDPQCRMSA